MTSMRSGEHRVVPRATTHRTRGARVPAAEGAGGTVVMLIRTVFSALAPIADR
jgi:hypothetical protein